MSRQRADFYIGIITWLSVSIVLLSFWEEGTIRVQSASFYYPLIPAIFFLMFVSGFTLSNGTFHRSINRSHRLMGLGTSALSVALVITIFGFNYTGILTVILAAQLPEFFRRRTSIGLALLFPFLGNLFDYFFFNTEYTLASFVLYSLFNIFALYASSKAISEEKAKLESQRLLRELKSTQIFLAATIKRAERVRISQDLHDVFGHHLTALSLQLEVASHVSGENVYENIERAKSICRLLLSDTREAVSEIRKNSQLDLQETLNSLTQNISGLNVELAFDIDESKINEREAEVIFRCVQEGITNSLKHAAASECKIHLFESGHGTILKYSDNGTSEHEITPGNGLKGLKERVLSLDGELTFNNNNNGFFLDVILNRTLEKQAIH